MMKSITIYAFSLRRTKAEAAGCQYLVFVMLGAFGVFGMYETSGIPGMSAMPGALEAFSIMGSAAQGELLICQRAQGTGPVGGIAFASGVNGVLSAYGPICKGIRQGIG